MNIFNMPISNIFEDFVNFMSIANNIIQFAIFLMALITIFYIFSIKYIRPIKVLLYPLGIKKGMILKALFLCRKNPRKYIRIFCEYFILKTNGQHQQYYWWNREFYEFEAFFKDSYPDRFIYEFDNCTDILDENISNQINDYFEYFDNNKTRKTYNLNQNQPITFCMDIKINQGYLCPNFLLSGLLERYKNNWANLVNKYISTASNKKYSDLLYSSEVYYTFAWLLWGPSYKLKDQEGHYKLCQYAFGDECNSVIVVLNNEPSLKKLWKEISGNYNINGLLCTLTCKLYKAKSYINQHRENFSPVNNYFINKVTDENTGFILEPVSYEVKENYKAQNYYCTAYVWIMFEAINGDNHYFQPQKSITFFEHANLANQLSYEACIRSLINKCFDHFDTVFSDNRLNRKYRYCLSMNQTIEDKFLKRLDDRVSCNDDYSIIYKENIYIDKLYSESDIFSSFDSYFEDSEDEFKYVEIDINDKNSMIELGEYYTSIYIESFPDANERESLDSIIGYLTKKSQGWYKKNNYHVILVLKSGKIVGGIICDYFADSNCGAIEFMAIKEEYQSGGIGTRIYQKSVEILRKDARLNSQNELDYIFGEIEKVNDNKSIDDKKYLWFWWKMGYKKIDFDYIQPALDSNKQCVSSLDLILIQLSHASSLTDGISTNTLKGFLIDYAKYAMRIEQSENNPDLLNMINKINNLESSTISLKSIIN